MPATRRKRSRKNPTSSIVPNNFSLTDVSTWHLATVSQLCSLSAESLRLHLTARNLVSTGNKSVMAQQLYDSIHSTPPDHSSGSSANPESSATQSNQPTVTNNAMSGTTHTTASDQQVSLGIQLQQLQSQHLANLLLQAASQLSATVPSSSNTVSRPASTQVQAAAHNAPISETTMASQQAMVSHNAATQSPQQDDQLSKASAFVSPIQPSEPQCT